MQLILRNGKDGRRWRIRPYQNGMCLQIDKSPMQKVNPKNGREIKSEFVSCERYPSTWPAAVATVVKLMLSDPEDEATFEVDASEIEKGIEEIIAGKVAEITFEIKED